MTKLFISQKRKTSPIVDFAENTSFWRLVINAAHCEDDFLLTSSFTWKRKISFILFVLFLVVDYKLVRILDSCCILVLNCIPGEDCIQEEDCIRVKDWTQETDCIQVSTQWWVSRFLLVQGIPDAGTKYFGKRTESLLQTKNF